MSAYVESVNAHDFDLEEVPVGTVPDTVDETSLVMFEGSLLAANYVKDLFECSNES